MYYVMHSSQLSLQVLTHHHHQLIFAHEIPQNELACEEKNCSIINYIIIYMEDSKVIMSEVTTTNSKKRCLPSQAVCTLVVQFSVVHFI